MRTRERRMLGSTLTLTIATFLATHPALTDETQQAKCPALKGLALPDVTIASATAVATPTAGPVKVAHCRVDGSVGKTSASPSCCLRTGTANSSWAAAAVSSVRYRTSP
jgi:hypothetical protein